MEFHFFKSVYYAIASVPITNYFGEYWIVLQRYSKVKLSLTNY